MPLHREAPSTIVAMSAWRPARMAGLCRRDPIGCYLVGLSGASARKVSTPIRSRIWTPQQLAGFLPAAEDDRLYALWYLIALRGLGRGEALALRWTDPLRKRLLLT
jgi:integrase